MAEDYGQIKGSDWRVLRRWKLGSVSLAVLQTSRRPVLVVWPPVE